MLMTLFLVVSSQSSFAQFYFACFKIQAGGALERESSIWLMPHHNDLGVISSLSYGSPSNENLISIDLSEIEQSRFAEDFTFKKVVGENIYTLEKSNRYDGHFLRVMNRENRKKMKFVCYQDGTV